MKNAYSISLTLIVLILAMATTTASFAQLPPSVPGLPVCCIIEIPGIAKWYSLKLQTEFPNYAMYFAA